MALSPTAVEATSLSSVVEIAANPPIHPYTQPRTNAIPITLYIARVPGSKDIFLTPHKPREKVVSAEDVLAALYFIHVNTEADCQVTNPTTFKHEHTDINSGRSISRTNVPQRKPTLPPRSTQENSPITPPYFVYDESEALSRSRRVARPNEFDNLARKPLQQTQPTRMYPPVLLNITNMPKPRQEIDQTAMSVPAQRNLPSPPAERYSDSVHSNNMHLLKEQSHDEIANPYFPRYGNIATHSVQAIKPNSNSSLQSQAALNIDIEKRPTTVPFTNFKAPDSPFTLQQQTGTLTLIRRDPASGQQWNVACISDPPVLEVSSAALHDSNTAAPRIKKGGAPLYLDITNPSYMQFAGHQQQQDSLNTRQTSLDGSRTRSSESSDQSTVSEGTFRRRLYMPGSKNRIHDYAHSKHLSVDSAMGNSTSKTMRQRSSVDLSAPRIETMSRAYSFTSPWDGRCEFATGVSGKSLKCKHTLPNHRVAEIVSELRFNLPSASRNTPILGVDSDKRASYFSHLRKKSHDSSLDHNNQVPSPNNREDGRMDLTLGQEKAGGGFGGKQAKLGKLIIEPEGLKMLDLLVAANIGLWWRAYQK